MHFRIGSAGWCAGIRIVCLAPALGNDVARHTLAATAGAPYSPAGVVAADTLWHRACRWGRFAAVFEQAIF